MKVYLISNNLVLDGIRYLSQETIEQKRLSRPLAIEGEKSALRLSKNIKVQTIYSSAYASALATAKYIAEENNCLIKIDSALNDAKIGDMGKHNIKMLRYMQERNLEFKYPNGESLNETSRRMKKIFLKILAENNENIAIITHKRAILALLLNYCEKGFNLDDRLILTFHDQVIIDDSENDCDVLELEINEGNIEKINVF